MRARTRRCARNARTARSTPCCTRARRCGSGITISGLPSCGCLRSPWMARIRSRGVTSRRHRRARWTSSRSWCRPTVAPSSPAGQLTTNPASRARGWSRSTSRAANSACSRTSPTSFSPTRRSHPTDAASPACGSRTARTTKRHDRRCGCSTSRRAKAARLRPMPTCGRRSRNGSPTAQACSSALTIRVTTRSSGWRWATALPATW